MKNKSPIKKKKSAGKGRIGSAPHPGGRPTIYDPVKTLEATREYIESCKDGYTFTPVEATIYLNDGDDVKEKTKKETAKVKQSTSPTKMKMQRVVRLPTIEGLAVHLHIHKDTIHEWRKIHAEFSDLIDDLLNKQANALINNGLSGEYSQIITKVLLVKHGYIDRQDSENKHKGLPSLSTLLKKAAERSRGEA